MLNKFALIATANCVYLKQIFIYLHKAYLFAI